MISRFAVGTKVVQRYEVIEVRRGGMGEVAICRDLTSKAGPPVAIKAISPEIAGHPDARKRFDREVEAWMSIGRVPFGFILPLEEVIRDGEDVLIKMPFCSRGSLRDRLKEGPLPRTTAADYATQLLLGLRTLSGLGLVHRDLKPENILITDDDRLQVADMGLARVDRCEVHPISREQATDNLTQFGQFLGTVAYAPPEQMLGVQVDMRADFWAFGVIVYEMFMGHHPYSITDIASHLRSVLSGARPSLRELGNRGNDAVVAVVERCLTSDPGGRFSSVKELAAAWDRAIKTPGSPKTSWLKRDQRIELAPGPAESAWLGCFFPERFTAKDEVLLGFEISALTGVSEARDYYRLDRYDDAVRAAEKALGSTDDPSSNFSRLLNGQLRDENQWERSEVDGRSRSRLVPESGLAKEAVRCLLSSLVALAEQPSPDERNVKKLVEISRRIATSSLADGDILVLAAQGYLLCGEYTQAEAITRRVLDEEPLHTPGGFVLYQALRRSGASEDATRLATRLIEAYVSHGNAEHQVVAARMAYVIEDWETAVRIGSKALATTPSDFETLSLVTSALLLLKRRDEARPYYDRMRRLAPNSPRIKQLAPAFGVR